jgi:hypothetical protein
MHPSSVVTPVSSSIVRSRNEWSVPDGHPPVPSAAIRSCRNSVCCVRCKRCSRFLITACYYRTGIIILPSVVMQDSRWWEWSMMVVKTGNGFLCQDSKLQCPTAGQVTKREMDKELLHSLYQAPLLQQPGNRRPPLFTLQINAACSILV